MHASHIAHRFFSGEKGSSNGKQLSAPAAEHPGTWGQGRHGNVVAVDAAVAGTLRPAQTYTSRTSRALGAGSLHHSRVLESVEEAPEVPTFVLHKHHQRV